MNKAVIQTVGEFLTSREMCFNVHADGESLEFDIAGEHGIWRVFATTNEDGRVLTIHSQLPARVPPDRRPRCAELLARLNHGDCIGKFQIEMDKGFIALCISSVLTEAAGNLELVEALIGFSLTTMDEHFAQLMACVYGPMDAAGQHCRPLEHTASTPESRFDFGRN